MMFGGNYGWGPGGGMGFGFGGIFMILFWGLIIFGIVYFAQAVVKKSGKSEQGDTPLDLLKKRYAKGEINKEEFERIKDDIMKS
jgi:putative membrane protein